MSTNSDEGIGSALVRSAAIENIADLAADVAEIVLDSAAFDDVIKDIPVFGSLYKIYKAGSSVRELLFVKKIAKFLQAAGTIPPLEQQRFLRDMEREPEVKQKVGETVLLLLERADDFAKASMIGTLFAAYAAQKIDFVLFRELANIVEKCSISALRELLSERAIADLVVKTNIEALQLQEVRIDVQGELYRAGLLTMGVRKFVTPTYVRAGGSGKRQNVETYEQQYTLNEMALALIQILVGKMPESGKLL